MSLGLLIAMNIYGRKPDLESGEHFSATRWSWRPILGFMRHLCPDLLDEKTLELMETKRGAGPHDTATCQEMANRFALWMEYNAEGHGLEMDGIRMKPDGKLLMGDRLTEVPEEEMLSAYEVKDDHLNRWIEFLRHCGGFQVW